MNSQYSQTRITSILDNLELYNMRPDEIFSHSGLENRYIWSSDKFNHIGQNIARRKYTAFRSKTRRIKRYSSEVKPELKVLKSEIRHEHVNNFNQLNTEENLEFDIFIKMPPVKERVARIKIKRIEKAKMRFVEPE